MYKKDSTIRIMVSGKLFILAIALFLVGFYGCKKNQFAPTTSNAVSTKVAQSVVPCGTPLVSNLVTSQNVIAGSVTVYNTHDSLYILIQTVGNWKFSNTDIYVGTLAGMPHNPQWNPTIPQFPYSSSYNPLVSSKLLVLPLSGLPPCYIVAARVKVKEVTGQNQGQGGQAVNVWPTGTYFNANQPSFGMYLSYCTQACPCVYPVQSQDLFAGQTIDVGSVDITNDADSVYVTYNLTGNWYFNSVHLYVGTLAGMPVSPGNGNPIPGQFPIHGNLSGSTVQSVTYSYPLAGLHPCYIVAAHADIYQTDGAGNIIQNETAWGFGDPFNSPKWGWTIPYCTASCE